MPGASTPIASIDSMVEGNLEPSHDNILGTRPVGSCSPPVGCTTLILGRSSGLCQARSLLHATQMLNSFISKYGKRQEEGEPKRLDKALLVIAANFAKQRPAGLKSRRGSCSCCADDEI
jgi:hypothetical protein